MRQAVGRGPEPRTATPDGSGGTVRGVRRRFRRRPTPAARWPRPADTDRTARPASRNRHCRGVRPPSTRPAAGHHTARHLRRNAAVAAGRRAARVRTLTGDAARVVDTCCPPRGQRTGRCPLAQRPAAMTVEAAAEGPQRFRPGGSMEPVTGHLTAAGRTLPGHPVRPHDDVAAQDRTPQAADGQSAACSLPLNRRSLRLVTTFSTSLKAGPAGGRLRRPSSAGCTTRPGRCTVLTAQTLHAAKGAGIGTPRGATKKLYRGGAEWAPLHSVFSSIPYCLSS
jgi:hypothetical protein